MLDLLFSPAISFFTYHQHSASLTSLLDELCPIIKLLEQIRNKIYTVHELH